MSQNRLKPLGIWIYLLRGLPIHQFKELSIMSLNKDDACDGLHVIVQDSFAKISSVKRHIPGDCYCIKCKKPIAAFWNKGEPIPAEDNSNEETRTN